MDSTIFVQAVSRIRAIENKLLDNAKLNRMIESSTADEAMKVLAESEYSQFMGNVKRVDDYEILLSEELKRVYSLMYDISPVKIAVDILSLKYDYHNLKVLFKAKALNKDFDYLLIPIGKTDLNLLKDAIFNKNYIDLSKIMRSGIEKLEEEFEHTKDPQKIDLILDKYMYEEMFQLAKEFGDKYTLSLVQKNIDLNNVLSFLRIKKQKKDREFLKEVILDNGTIDMDVYLAYFNDSPENFASKLSYTDYGNLLREGVEEYSKSGKLNRLEKLRDNFIMQVIKDAKYVSFGVEPLIAYIYAKESEIKAIRTIMVGKLNNIEPDVIKGRLRDIYV